MRDDAARSGRVTRMTLATAYHFLLLASALIAGAIAVVAWQRRQAPGASSLIVLMLCEMWWSGFYLSLHEQGSFCSLTHGMHELTIIYDARHTGALDTAVTGRPLHENTGVASISVRFSPRYIDVPGLLYLLIQRVTLQNVNLIEISSTYTETMLFVAESDARLVFDTIFESFLVRATAQR
jgi:hypothetical protein